MKIKHFIFPVVLILFISCSSNKKTTSAFGNANVFSASTPKDTDDGLSFATAIVITEKSEMKGTSAEYSWIKSHYSNYKTKGQALSMSNKKPYDIITIILSDGKEVPLYFDISNFFGRF